DGCYRTSKRPALHGRSQGTERRRGQHAVDGWRHDSTAGMSWTVRRPQRERRLRILRISTAPARPPRTSSPTIVEHDGQATVGVLSYGDAVHPGGNGNLTSKSDVGTLVYGDGDPKHPHAVTSAGNDTFAYDAVGNQTQRPGAAIAYTP